MILISSNTSSFLWSYVSHTEPQLRKVILPDECHCIQIKQNSVHITSDTQSDCQSMSVMYGTAFMCIDIALCQ